MIDYSGPIRLPSASEESLEVALWVWYGVVILGLVAAAIAFTLFMSCNQKNRHNPSSSYVRPLPLYRLA